MSNTLLTINMITNEAVRLFTQTNAFLRRVNRQYDDQFARTGGAKIGETLRIRLPNDYLVQDGPAITPQGTAEQSTTLTVSKQKVVPVSFGTAERTMSLDDYSERILAPAVNRLAAQMAADLMTVADSSAGLSMKTSGGNLVSPDSGTFLDAGATLDLNLAPRMDRVVVLDPRTQARVVPTMAGLFNPQVKISEQYESGLLGRDTLGFDWMYDQTAIVHTVGSFTAGTVNGAGQTGNTLVTNAITGTLNEGDVITIAGVNAINRLTGEDQGELRQFVVTADVASGATSIPIYPAIVPAPAAFNTVTASPANSAAISLVATAGSKYRKNLAFYPEAFTLATADLVMPTSGVVEAARAEFDGVAMRMITAYDVMSDNLVTRLDVLYGFAAIRPEWSVVVADVL